MAHTLFRTCWILADKQECKFLGMPSRNHTRKCRHLAHPYIDHAQHICYAGSLGIRHKSCWKLRSRKDQSRHRRSCKERHSDNQLYTNQNNYAMGPLPVGPCSGSRLLGENASQCETRGRLARTSSYEAYTSSHQGIHKRKRTFSRSQKR